MTTEAIPAPTPEMTRYLAPLALEDHRAQIGREVQIVLSGYWQSQHDQNLEAAILADWMDELEDWHIDQIRWALRKWRSLNPSKKPNPSHIVGVLKGERGRTFVAQRDGKQFEPLFAIDRRPLLAAE